MRAHDGWQRVEIKQREEIDCTEFAIDRRRTTNFAPMGQLRAHELWRRCCSRGRSPPRLLQTPNLYEIGKIRKEIGCGVYQHQPEEISRSGPNDAKENTAYRERDNGIGDGIEPAGICAQSFHCPRVPEDETGCMSKSKDERHQNNATDFGAEPRAQACLKESPKKEFLNESRFDRQPDETEWQTD
jgi:hypothetical protein